MKLLEWLGQEHANYHLGLFAPEGAALTADDLYRLLGAVAHDTGAVGRKSARRSRSTGTAARTRLPNCGISSRRAAATP